MHPRPLFTAALLCLATALSAVDQPATLELLHRLADGQLAHPSKHKPTDWTQAAKMAACCMVDIDHRDRRSPAGSNFQVVGNY